MYYRYPVVEEKVLVSMKDLFLKMNTYRYYRYLVPVTVLLGYPFYQICSVRVKIS